MGKYKEGERYGTQPVMIRRCVQCGEIYRTATSTCWTCGGKVVQYI